MSNTRYRTIRRVVEAIQVPQPDPKNDNKMRAVAIWMVENGYAAFEELTSVVLDRIHSGEFVLPEFGVNFIEVEDAFSDDGYTAGPGDWIVKGVKEWVVLDAATFAAAYEPAS